MLIFRLTNSTVLLGVLQFAQFGPILLLAPWTGSAADRFDRRKLLLATQAAQTTLTATLAGLAFAGAATEYVVLGFAFALGILTALALPAQQALHRITRRAGRPPVRSRAQLDDLQPGSRSRAEPRGSRHRPFGVAMAFAVNSISYVPLAVAVFIARPRPQERAESSRLTREPQAAPATTRGWPPTC